MLITQSVFSTTNVKVHLLRTNVGDIKSGEIVMKKKGLLRD